MLKKLIFTMLPLVIFGLSSCMPYTEEKLTEINPDGRDSICQQIFTLQDEQNTAALYPYFQHKNPTYRYLAALSFASIKDIDAIDSLAFLLHDDIDEVGAAAAFAIGQMKDEKCISVLSAAFDTLNIRQKTNSAILEAVGKCGDISLLNFMSESNRYTPKDTILLEGQAWGIYRFALRKITSPKGTQRMVDLLTNPAVPNSVHFIAANYLYRAQNIHLDSLSSRQIVDIFKETADPRIQMTLAVAIGKSKTDYAFQALSSVLGSTEDYRTSCNIIRALGNFPYIDSAPLVYLLLTSENQHIANRAAQYFVENGLPEEATNYWTWAKEEMPWAVQIALYTAANKHLPVYFVNKRNSLNAELRTRFVNSENAYEKAACLRALAEFGWNYRYVFREGLSLKEKYPVVATAGVESLAAISDAPNFINLFNASSNYIRRELAANFRQAIETGDAGMVAVAAIALRNKDRNYKAIYRDSTTFLNKALAKLSLPKEIETYNEVKATIDLFNGIEESIPRKTEFSHPIDWKVLTGAKKRPEVVMQTDKGLIELELLADIAPGSVINFLSLTRAGFFDDKKFHRVVANFVAQGGCPRGDGYGSLDYSIRSEFSPLHYDKAGYVGMASAGDHTEGTQFFFTHSPTPHLDGNYTIFARVSAGMEVVHQIQQGDLIKLVEEK